MRIGIDARCLEGRRTGMGRYLVNLLSRWGEIAPDNKYILYTKNEVPSDKFLDKGCFIKKAGPALLSWRGPIWEQLYLPRAISRDKIDLFFSPAYTTPLFTACPRVVVLHDVSYEANPKWYPLLERLYLRMFSRRSAQRANLVITDSEEAKREIVKYYRLPANKIKVVYSAADKCFRQVENVERIGQTKEKLGITGRFILYIGMIFSRRNIPELLKAFSLVKKEIKDCQLVLVGENKTNPFQDIGGIIRDLRLEESVIWLDYVDDEDILLLYNGAELFVYLSSYEGFGLPVLEAMQCGTPVVVANRSCLPEIAGDAAILVNPEDTQEVARAISTLLSDAGLSDRMEQKSLERARTFSWGKTARETLDALQRVSS